jgi:hypothetical protein
MAITSADLQAQLGTNPNDPQVDQHFGVVGSEQHWYIRGGPVHPGRVKFVKTTASDNAATQKTAVLAALAAGPA